MKHKILAICTAYEQGYGHGYDQRGLSNPYAEKTDEREAWDYGYSEGSRKQAYHKVNEKSLSALPAGSVPDLERDALRYRWLRERDLDTIDEGGVFAGVTPANLVLIGDDLDEAIDLAMAQMTKHV